MKGREREILRCSVNEKYGVKKREKRQLKRTSHT